MLELGFWQAGFDMLGYILTARPADTTPPPPPTPPLDCVTIYTGQEHTIQYK